MNLYYVKSMYRFKSSRQALQQTLDGSNKSSLTVITFNNSSILKVAIANNSPFLIVKMVNGELYKLSKTVKTFFTTPRVGSRWSSHLSDTRRVC